jgi:hypothetical protein
MCSSELACVMSRSDLGVGSAVAVWPEFGCVLLRLHTGCTQQLARPDPSPLWLYPQRHSAITQTHPPRHRRTGGAGFGGLLGTSVMKSPGDRVTLEGRRWDLSVGGVGASSKHRSRRRRTAPSRRTTLPVYAPRRALPGRPRASIPAGSTHSQPIGDRHCLGAWLSSQSRQ